MTPKVNSLDTIEKSIETSAERIESLLSANYAISKMSIALLLLQEDKEIYEIVNKTESKEIIEKIDHVIKRTVDYYPNPVSYELAMERQANINYIVNKAVRSKKAKFSFQVFISQLTMNPITGLPILALILYLGIYKFVGQFGAGTVVDFLERKVFGLYINPFVTGLFERFVPWGIINDLFVGEYGVITLGVRYAMALILPIVSFFFLIFSIIEDSGYLPRLAMLIDRTFKKIGLSGRAVIPMVLGFGCDTMATVVTRTLPTVRERIISTILLSLAIPCSAQLGVIVALLEGKPKAFMIWAFVLTIIFLFIGYLSSKIIPGEKPSFYMELPPLRLPKLSNVLIKTYARVRWYFFEIMPIFLFASVVIWVGKITGIFDVLINFLKKPMAFIGLPPELAKVFLFGFFRRDYGMAGLYDINNSGLLTGVQLVVSTVFLTLFIPCVAQFLVTVKERGWKTGAAISFFILFFSFFLAYVVNKVLLITGAVI